MSLTINSEGNQLVGLPITGILHNLPTKSTLIPLGGVDKDALQHFGKSNSSVSFEGYITDISKKVFLENIIGNTGSISFTSEPNLISFFNTTGDFFDIDFYFEDFLTSNLGTYSVYFRSLNWKDKGSRPMEKGFILEVDEIR